MNTHINTSDKFIVFANHHSMQCFYNSFLREWKNWSYDNESQSIEIVLTKNKILKLRVKNYSLVGRHTYLDEILFVDSLENSKRQVSFIESIDLVINEIKTSFSTNDETINVFKNRVLQSRDHIAKALSIKGNDYINILKSEDPEFIDIENSLYIGHSFHPHPKNRDGFSENDSLSYSPEFGNEFSLSWMSVDKRFIHEFSSDKFEDKDWMMKMFREQHSIELKSGHSAFLVHPYQKNILLQNDKIIEHLKFGNIVDLNLETQSKWKATSSLRSIYNQKSKYMLKFSLSVRLTNSIRHLLTNEVLRGVQVMDVFKTSYMESFKKEFKNFKVINEPGFMAIKDINGKILEETIVNLRENVFLENSKNKYVLATLTQDLPDKDISVLGNLILNKISKTKEDKLKVGIEFFKGYLKNAFMPLLVAQSKYGVLFGAHQQNIILELNNAIPVRGYFRDCQGAGFSKLGFKALSNQVDFITESNGNVLDEEITNTLIPYYLYVNSTLNVIASLSRDLEIDEQILLNELRNELEKLNRDESIKDKSCIEYLLYNKTIKQKGNFFCSLVDMNENTTENPFVIYNEMLNPLNEIK